MRIRSLLALAVLAAASLASEEESRTPQQKIEPLLIGLRSDNEAEAVRKLRAQRREFLPILVGLLERATDPDRKQQLLEILQPDTLKPLGEPALLKKIGLAAAMQPLLDDALGDDETARAAAEQRLAASVPYAAVVVQAHIDAEEDVAKRVRLRILYYRMLDDTPERADTIFKAAQGLNTLASNFGPLRDRWDSAETVKLRSRAKVLHWCFVDPGVYAASIKRDIGMYMPHRDLPAARDLYMLAHRIYATLAEEEADDIKAGKLRANAAAAAKAADECAQAAPRVKGE